MLLAVMQVTQYKRSVRGVSKEFNIPHKTLGRYCIAKRLPSIFNALVLKHYMNVKHFCRVLTMT